MIKHSRLTEECPIDLKPHQINHVKNIWDLFYKDQAFSYIDVSQTGLGKTFVSLYLAWHLQKLYNIKVVIVAPSETSLDNDDGWKVHAKNYGVDIFHATTYKGLLGKKNTWLKNNPDKKDILVRP